ncbi:MULTISPECIES: hypothetical protein [Atlantibacter]|uniref:Uncharacterized protein n=1 Tax=Atlantibacter subterraneus TaxID=255519 RepID=A0ABU4E5N5_9ENTR|nr:MULTISPECIES: hypothetical protein [Atlantibacter]MDV7024444.1 hypothetical protein [Atlantibacter subterranea]MDW2745008.1 hypothetical protein [Atlantibacter subterranea]MDZ5667540.1 hypothetical protein [Atlantibacter hermannii]QFH72895.1 hypothetical protein FR762_24365 [Enterobacter sp. E76]
MTFPEHIGPVTVVRDPDGFWTHPRYFNPEGDEASRGEFGDWLHRHNLTCATCWMENDAPPHVMAAWVAGNGDVSDWHPSMSAGEGWFIGSVHDTEDGPVCVWLREAR